MAGNQFYSFQIINSSMLHSPPLTSDQPQVMGCRDRYGHFNASFFALWACSWCYTYLFPDAKDLVLAYAKWEVGLRTLDGEYLPNHIPLYPGLFSEGVTEVKDEAVCHFLGQEGCDRLARCCTAAVSCCEQQTKLSKNLKSPIVSCPHTWDGFACYGDTPAGSVAHVTCPSYVYSTNWPAVSSKTCLGNGTWWRPSQTSLEWTDYSACVDLKGFRILYYVGMSLNATSLICLLPASIIFLSFKQLLKQHRIRIHLNLFLSFVLTNGASLCWDYLVFKDRLDNREEDSYMHTELTLCRLQNILTRYARSCNFAWMTLEGFHLYRLINHAFKAPKSIMIYYVWGWLLPCLPLCVYAMLRKAKQHGGCWVNHAGELEWVLYGPYILCMSLNVIFLVAILKILLTKLQSHPNEPSSYRRALKATCILVPLFGLQIFLYVYRQREEIADIMKYEIFATVVCNSQGAVVSLVFCFLNSEVHTQFRSHFARRRSQSFRQDARSYTFSSEGRRISTKGSNLRVECIPLTGGSPCRSGTASVNDSPRVDLPVGWKVSTNKRGSSLGAPV